MRGALSAHEQIYDEEKKQSQPSTVDGFLKRLAPPQEEPQAGPSGDGPEGGTAAAGGDRSPRADLSTGQGGEAEDGNGAPTRASRHRHTFVPLLLTKKCKN